MRRASAIVFMMSLLLSPALLLAQEELTSEQLRRMYDDAIAQMKATQDRRNELARDNQKLKDRIAELEKEVEKTQAKLMEIADSTLKARSEMAAFKEFLQGSPAIKAQWLAFLQKNLISAADPKQLLDTDWPLPSVR